MNDFEKDLKKIRKQLREDEDLAQALSQALNNTDWRKILDKNYIVGYTFRAAANLVADLRGLGESYSMFYMGGDKKLDEIINILENLGWEIDAIGYMGEFIKIRNRFYKYKHNWVWLCIDCGKVIQIKLDHIPSEKDINGYSRCERCGEIYIDKIFHPKKYIKKEKITESDKIKFYEELQNK